MKNKKTYLIAEIGSNHDGSLEQALKMIEESAKSGADAVKFQTFQAEELLVPVLYKDGKAEENWVYNELKKVEINEIFHQKAAEKCHQLGIDFISSPFDDDSLKIVSKYCDRIKIASSEVTNLPLLSQVGSSEKPVILSTGMATLGEVENAVQTLVAGGVTDLTLLHCVSLYPLKWEEANLQVLKTLQSCFGLPVGFSDHSLDETLSIAAVSMGASIIEKHVTFKREDRIFDHSYAVEFPDFKEMSEKIYLLEQALGDGVKKLSAEEMEIRNGSHKSFFTRTELKAGEALTLNNIKAVRPLIGIPVKHQETLLGKKLQKDLPANSPIFWEDVK